MSNRRLTPSWTWRVTSSAGQEETSSQLSWVRCAVVGCDGVTVRLASCDGRLELISETGSRPEYGPYFCQLGPVKSGWYTLSVEGAGGTVDLWLDGTGSATVTFSPIHQIAHIVFLGSMLTRHDDLLALTRYVARFGAVVTFDAEEAARGAHVVMAAFAHELGEAMTRQLQGSGSLVEWVRDGLASHLEGAVQAGTQYLFT